MNASQNQQADIANTTVDQKEVEHFSSLAQEWWNENGKFRPLHKFNPIRIHYISQKVFALFHKDPSQQFPLSGLSILDVGCGGGLLSVPMARLGAKVTGIDPSEKNIKIAQIHAKKVGIEINYAAKTTEELAAQACQFDVILNMEVVEHVQNMPLFLKSCAKMLKPGGIMFIATINRNWKSFGLAIIAAEYILRWLPKGTHQYSKFFKPEELEAELAKNGLKLIDQTGVTYNPLKDSWGLSEDMSVNYMLLAQRFA